MERGIFTLCRPKYGGMEDDKTKVKMLIGCILVGIQPSHYHQLKMPKLKLSPLVSHLSSTHDRYIAYSRLQGPLDEALDQGSLVRSKAIKRTRCLQPLPTGPNRGLAHWRNRVVSKTCIWNTQPNSCTKRTRAENNPTNHYQNCVLYTCNDYFNMFQNACSVVSCDHCKALIHLNCQITAFNALFHDPITKTCKKWVSTLSFQWQCTRSCVTNLMNTETTKWK